MNGESMTIAQGLELTIVAMLIVFFTLYLISLILEGFRHLGLEEKKEEKVVKAPVVREEVATTKNPNSLIEEDEDAVIAALVATIDANGDRQDKNFKVTAIKRI